MSTPKTALGVAGKLVLSEPILDGAKALAAADFAQAQADEFCGDPVRDHWPPDWMGDVNKIFPLEELAKLQLRPAPEMESLYATCGVDSHTDHIDGLSVVVVLYSDGFTFKQGKTKLKLNAGDWFIFDDRLAHAAIDSKGSTSLVFLTAPLNPIGS